MQNVIWFSKSCVGKAQVVMYGSYKIEKQNKKLIKEKQKC